MDNSKYQTLLISSKTTPKAIEQFCLDFDRTKVASLLEVLVSAQQSLAKSDPHVQLNALLTVIGFARLADYTAVAFADALLLQYLEIPARTAASGDNKHIYDYFQKAGLASSGNTQSLSSGNTQSLSYHFTRNALLLVLLLAYLRPKRLYKNRELSSPSRAKLLEGQLRQSGLSEQDYNQLSSTNGFLGIRKEFLRTIVALQRHSDSFVQPLIRALQKFLVSGSRNRTVQCAVGLLKSHQDYFSTEAVPRLAEIFCYHNDFRVRKEALLLICQVVYSGDLQATVLINFTEYFRMVALKVADAALHAKFNKMLIFPEVAGQVQEKRLFLNQFLLAVERMARLFPSLQAYFLNSGEAPLLQIYRKLTECGARFPRWQDSDGFLQRVGNKCRANREYNLQFLEQLQRQRVEWLVLDPMHPTYQNLLHFLDRNTRTLAELRAAATLNPNDDNWLSLLDFKNHFEELLQRVTDDVPSEDLDQLIYRGLALKSNIVAVETLQQRYERAEISHQQFQQGLAMPPPQDAGLRRKAIELGSAVGGREKQSIKVILSKSESVVKSKVNLRIQQLAGKKAESVEVISHLEIYSRSFIAHKLHSQQIMHQFLPLLYFHPLRKLKRKNNGIRICSEQRSPSPKHRGDSTPKFRSVLEQGKGSRKGLRVMQRQGLRVMQRQGAKYEKYLQVLSRREWIKFLTSDAVVVLDRGWARIERSQIRSNNLPQNQILEVTFTCHCQQAEIKYIIAEEPSIEVKSRKRAINTNKNSFQLQIKGLWAKFGFTLPTITFLVKEETVTLPLPFSFNNYLSISPSLKPPRGQATASQRYKLDRKQFPYIQSVKKFLRGMKIQGNKLGGWVRFFSWECNLRIALDAESFLLQIQPTVQRQDDILADFLPLFLVRLLALPQ